MQALRENQPSITAKMWAYRGVDVKLDVFDFTVSRHRDGPELFFFWPIESHPWSPGWPPRRAISLRLLAPPDVVLVYGFGERQLLQKLKAYAATIDSGTKDGTAT